MHNVIQINSLVSETEQTVLCDWITDHKDTSIFCDSEHATERRRDTSIAIPDRFTYPQCAYDIKQRIVDNLKLQDPKLVPYPYGMLASYVLPGDKRMPRRDFPLHYNHTIYHCLLLLSPIQGALQVINGNEYNLNPRDGLFYSASDLDYCTTELTGDNPGLFWLFGFSVPNEQTEN